MNITAIIYDAAVRKTAYILGTVIGNCKLFPAERAPRDWSGYANVITVAAGEGGPVVTAGVQKRVTFRPKGEDETVAAAELIAKAFCPPEAPMPTDALKARIDTLADDFQGVSDLLAGLDSAAAQAARARMASLAPEAMGAYYQDMAHYAVYAHGTHVAGIAAAGNPAARLLSARSNARWEIPPPVFDDAAAQSYAAAMRDAIAYFKANGVRVVNMSWGMYPAYLAGLLAQAGVPGTPEDHRRMAEARFTVMREALDGAIAGAPEILFIAAAGNAANDASFDRLIPSGLSHPHLLTVGAVDQAGDAANFTSSGSLVRVYASGVDVASVVPGGRKVSMSGTSMAAPQVTNLAAKLLAIDPSLTPQQVIALILEASTPSDDGKRRLMHAARSIELLEARRKTP